MTDDLEQGCATGHSARKVAAFSIPRGFKGNKRQKTATFWGPLLSRSCQCRICGCRNVWSHMYKHKFILGISIFIFSVLLAASIAVSVVLSSAQEREEESQALDLATETGEWFSNQLNLAILPLFSIAQFAVELSLFHNLPKKVGIAGTEGALPFNPPSQPGGPYTHRNITGVCDNPALMRGFDHIAARIKANAKMEGVLVNLQLAPAAVICLLYPLVNTEDFQNGIVLNNTPVRGLDLFVDPANSFIAKSTFAKDTVSIAGPLKLRQCRDVTCDAAVEKAFIARLPIADPNNTIQVDGITHNKWGFATALINWEALVTRSDIYQSFADRGMEFQLTRTDRNFNATSNAYDETVVVLAETKYFCSRNEGGHVVSKALQTTNNEWEITVVYNDAQVHIVKAVIITVCVTLSLCISILVYVTLVQRQKQLEMVASSLAQEASVETERNMTAYFAHELRNPLGAIDSALRTMPDDVPESARDLIAGMQLCTDFMASIMNNLLDVRKMEEGKMQLNPKPMSLSAFVLSVHTMLLPGVKEGVAFLVDLRTTDRDWVLADMHRLQQVLTNVVTNAMKYTSVGSITLSVGWEEDMVKIECIDTGPGIPKDQQEMMFERFVQRGSAPGSGLGLAIVKHIVTLMNGTIHFESDPTVQPGTNCVVLLPLTACIEPDDAGEKASAEAEVIEEALSFLIVDDLSINRRMLKRRLSQKIAPNCTITEACTGEEALEICANSNFDVIVVDQYMEEAGGVMHGTQVVREMRRLKNDAIIIGSSGNELNSQFIEAGADWTWQKPIPANAEIINELRSAQAGKHNL
ncbi:PAS fold [Fragilaria crotonensis]|nr:PAS fold [Fragilaria crotonensis]